MSTYNGWYRYNTLITLSRPEDENSLKIQWTSSSDNSGIVMPLTQENIIKAGDNLVLSFEYRGTLSSPLNALGFLTKPTSNPPFQVTCTETLNTASPSTWKKFNFNFTIPESLGDKVPYAFIFPYCKPTSAADLEALEGEIGVYLEIKDQTFKLEHGTKQTDWSPSPVDKADQTDINALHGRLSTAESNIIQTASNIEFTVRKNDVISSINQSAEEIKINANRITLSGDVVMKSNLTDGTTQISGSNITTGSINANLITTGELNANRVNLFGKMAIYNPETNSDGSIKYVDGEQVITNDIGGYVGMDTGMTTVYTGILQNPSDFESGQIDSDGDDEIDADGYRVRTDYIDITDWIDRRLFYKLESAVGINIVEYKSENGDYTHIISTGTPTQNVLKSINFQSETTHFRVVINFGVDSSSIVDYSNQFLIYYFKGAPTLGTILKDSNNENYLIITNNQYNQQNECIAIGGVRFNTISYDDNNQRESSVYLANHNFVVNNAESFLGQTTFSDWVKLKWGNDARWINSYSIPRTIYEHDPTTGGQNSGAYLTLTDNPCNFNRFNIEIAWNNGDYHKTRASTTVAVPENDYVFALPAITWYGTSYIAAAERRVKICTATDSSAPGFSSSYPSGYIQAYESGGILYSSATASRSANNAVITRITAWREY